MSPETARSKSVPKANGPIKEDALEEAFCRALAQKGDPQEVAILREIANFRAMSVMDLVISHVRFGINNGVMYEW